LIFPKIEHTDIDIYQNKAHDVLELSEPLLSSVEMDSYRLSIITISLNYTAGAICSFKANNTYIIVLELKHK